ncbi:MAG: hypothetical protein E7618_06060 [Ruminococcaceae bacterium]|nr:hypothetical protein [Oscillospiraceae bacterium]
MKKTALSLKIASVVVFFLGAVLYATMMMVHLYRSTAQIVVQPDNGYKLVYDASKMFVTDDQRLALGLSIAMLLFFAAAIVMLVKQRCPQMLVVFPLLVLCGQDMLGPHFTAKIEGEILSALFGISASSGAVIRLLPFVLAALLAAVGLFLGSRRFEVYLKTKKRR